MGHCPRILVCEHQPALREQLTRKLSANGFWIDSTDSSREALELLEQHRYDAMTLGLVLSDQDSISFLHDLRVLGFRLPVLVTSIHNEQEQPLPQRLVEQLDVELALCEEPEPDWVRKAADQARIIFVIKSACQGARGYRPRILHVEPDAFSAGLIKAALRGSAELVQVSDLHQLEDALCDGPYDFVVLNPLLHDDHGELALHRIAGAHANLPIVLHARYGIRHDEPDLWPLAANFDGGGFGLVQALRNVVLHGLDIPHCAHA
ncbi:response regulator [Thiohalobacter sp. IOR34]|uniref:response regulator n=1 Tax=Thiohalobacter sp. IOR34 TaxID=3057176 RepID=UPI0025B1D653|nr:response regulator [Thiohalobacter sp. IOR34]WJW74769.1 response regulator [Thiohalobacter sp. IOR34]